MGRKRIRLVGVEHRALPKPETLAREMYTPTKWIRTGRVIVHYAPEHKKDAKIVSNMLKKVFRELGLPVRKIELRAAPDHPDGDAVQVHSWLGQKKMGEPALHVGVGKFQATDTFGGVTYTALASASIGGTLAVHPHLLSSEKAEELLMHEVLHMLGLKHEHPLPIMDPLRPEWDETSKTYVSQLVKEILRIHGVKKKPWWRFW